MSRKGPLLTLLGGGALAIALLAASVNAASRDDEPPPAAVGDEQAETPAPTAAPTEAAEPEPETYVGYVDGGGASVAIIIDGEEATAYVCDGDTVEVWLKGEAVNDELLLSGKEGTLTGAYDNERASGETELQGRSWTFTADYVEPPEGLYQFAGTVPGGAEVEGNWIVLPDGTQIGILNVDGEISPAPALDPGTGEVTIDGETLIAQRQGA